MDLGTERRRLLLRQPWSTDCDHPKGLRGAGCDGMGKGVGVAMGKDRGGGSGVATGGTRALTTDRAEDTSPSASK